LEENIPIKQAGFFPWAVSFLTLVKLP
jgi:hypothetical protein